MADILVNGTQKTTTEDYRRDNGWMSKDDYRDMEFELGVYGEWEAPNGDHITKAEAA